MVSQNQIKSPIVYLSSIPDTKTSNYIDPLEQYQAPTNLNKKHKSPIRPLIGISNAQFETLRLLNMSYTLAGIILCEQLWSLGPVSFLNKKKVRMIYLYMENYWDIQLRMT